VFALPAEKQAKIAELLAKKKALLAEEPALENARYEATKAGPSCGIALLRQQVADTARAAASEAAEWTVRVAAKQGVVAEARKREDWDKAAEIKKVVVALLAQADDAAKKRQAATAAAQARLAECEEWERMLQSKVEMLEAEKLAKTAEAESKKQAAVRENEAKKQRIEATATKAEAKRQIKVVQLTARKNVLLEQEDYDGLKALDAELSAAQSLVTSERTSALEEADAVLAAALAAADAALAAALTADTELEKYQKPLRYLQFSNEKGTDARMLTKSFKTSRAVVAVRAEVKLDVACAHSKAKQEAEEKVKEKAEKVKNDENAKKAREKSATLIGGSMNEAAVVKSEAEEANKVEEKAKKATAELEKARSTATKVGPGCSMPLLNQKMMDAATAANAEAEEWKRKVGEKQKVQAAARKREDWDKAKEAKEEAAALLQEADDAATKHEEATAVAQEQLKEYLEWERLLQAKVEMLVTEKHAKATEGENKKQAAIRENEAKKQLVEVADSEAEAKRQAKVAELTARKNVLLEQEDYDGLKALDVELSAAQSLGTSERTSALEEADAVLAAALAAADAALAAALTAADAELEKYQKPLRYLQGEEVDAKKEAEELEKARYEATKAGAACSIALLKKQVEDATKAADTEAEEWKKKVDEKQKAEGDAREKEDWDKAKDAKEAAMALLQEAGDAAKTHEEAAVAAQARLAECEEWERPLQAKIELLEAEKLAKTAEAESKKQAATQASEAKKKLSGTTESEAEAEKQAKIAELLAKKKALLAEADVDYDALKALDAELYDGTLLPPKEAAGVLGALHLDFLSKGATDSKPPAPPTPKKEVLHSLHLDFLTGGAAPDDPELAAALEAADAELKAALEATDAEIESYQKPLEYLRSEAPSGGVLGLLHLR
jgi:hypothetical protein